MLGTRTATGKHGLFWLLGQLFRKRKDIVPNRSTKGKKEHRTRTGHPWQRQQDLACSSPSTMPATNHEARAQAHCSHPHPHEGTALGAHRDSPGSPSTGATRSPPEEEERCCLQRHRRVKTGTNLTSVEQHQVLTT